ncbi:MAG: hypothetical protein KFB93_09005 [Simkaniaceae bacterium]|nr:MAG: hypothetical protein KFB93_09005 [Simkaniaceae bacterium]
METLSSSSTSSFVRKDMQTSNFTEKMQALLTSFSIDHESSFLSYLDENLGNAIYQFYDGAVELNAEVKGFFILDALKTVLDECPADEVGAKPTFKGTLRANFIDLVRPELGNRAIFSEREAEELKPLIGSSLHEVPHAEVPRGSLVSTFKLPFEKLCDRYPEDYTSLITDLNGSCLAVQELYNQIKTPLTSEIDFYEVMMLVLEKCPLEGRGAPKTIRSEFRAHFVALFHQFQGEVPWKTNQERSIEKLLTNEEKVITISHNRRSSSHSPASQGVSWNPMMIAVGLLAAYLAYRFVAEPIYHWARTPKTAA